MEEGEDMIFDDAVKQIAATSSVTSDAMLVSQGVFLVYHMHASFSLFLHNVVLNFFSGTADFVQQFPSVVDSCEPEPSNQVPTCRKDLGEKRKLRLWSRGHLFIVRPCGYIDLWRPIYRYNYMCDFFGNMLSNVVTVETLSYISPQSYLRFG